ncbi:MAG TPA: ABC transporter permease [Solirubrobacteraceae bacterium]|nr:ABC transporter permease [Solirubrobacteraceae bacterium]
MPISGPTRWLLRLGSLLTLAFLYFPLVVIAIYAFNTTRVQTWPPSGLSLHWFDDAFNNSGARDALWTSVRVALGATAIALVLGSLAAYALARHDFFGKESVAFLLVLPIALPGIVTGMALNATFTQILHVSLAVWTIVVAHVTFCIVVIFNNVVARLRRTPASLEEAGADLGAVPRRTFADITFPQMRSALIAGALLAFALSFDEVIVTTFTAGSTETLPIWILSNLQRPNQLPVVNVVAVLVIVLSIIPVYIAQRLSADPVTAAGTVTDVPAVPGD